MIRKATAEDLARIAEIRIFNYRMYFYPIFRSDIYYFCELQVPSLAEYFAGEMDRLYVYDDGAVKGYVMINGTEVVNLFVEPVLHGKGIGSALLEFAVREHGADHLWVLEKNRDAIRFYERHGFRLTSEKKPEDGTSEFLIMMRRT